jgi:hypothetical protein
VQSAITDLNKSINPSSSDNIDSRGQSYPIDI